MNQKSFLYPILFMSLLTAISVFALAMMDMATAERVATLQETDLRTKIMYSFDIPIETTDPAEIEKIFTENIQEEDFQDTTIYVLKEGGQDAGYAFPVSGPGLWGQINAYVAINTDLSELYGIVFVKHEETPGLGGRIEEEAYLSQYRNLDLSSGTPGSYIISRPAPGGNIDAIAGATQTSNSVTKLLNEDITTFINARKGVQ